MRGLELVNGRQISNGHKEKYKVNKQGVVHSVAHLLTIFEIPEGAKSLTGVPKNVIRRVNVH